MGHLGGGHSANSDAACELDVSAASFQLDDELMLAVPP